MAALALGLLDWKEFGAAYARTMQATAQALAAALAGTGLPVFAAKRGATPPRAVGDDVTAFRKRFAGLKFVRR